MGKFKVPKYTHTLSRASGGVMDVYAMNNVIIKQPSISVGLPENRRLVQVLSLRMTTSECNTW